MIRKLPVLGAGVAMGLMAAACVPDRDSAQSGPTHTPPSIVVVEAVEGRIRDRVLATGSIEAVEEVYVSPLVDGLSIRAVTADRGDRVEGGSTLAVLNDDALRLEKSESEASLAKAEAAQAQAQAQLAEAGANADEATRVAERAARLSGNQTVSVAEADRLSALATAARARLRSAEQALGIATADIRVARARVDDVDLRLARTAVKAPVSGVISVRNAKVGAIASGGQPLYAIIRDGAVEMAAEVPETDLGKLAVGMPATVELAGGGTAVAGMIRRIAPTVDPQTRLGTVHIALADTAAARPGMYASATLIAEEKRAVILPRASITSVDGGAAVRKVDDGVVHLVPVSVGIEDGPFVEILSGLAAGDRAVAKAGVFVRDGDRIRAVEPAPPATRGTDPGP
ncbi:efflux RND transporter periplasmic adaptor subunit [Azospirillum halopraeferens]|uniref:efflux RND transporter periplasmic adaptor subunit n=1 Tax=Azospirillum halopraeferens TaxID=34010 RepID=UPI00048E51DD|nr:efflux RND transporter periplasmic adaptor subunit [Azospirillum halopraeferens]